MRLQGHGDEMDIGNDGGQKRNMTKPLLAGILFAVLLLAAFFSVHVVSHSAVTSPPVQPYAPTRHVLFISSYSESFETVDLQKKGIHEVFDANNVQLDIEYMDMKRHNTAENEANFYTMLRYKLRHRYPYDAVLLGDDAALEFARKHQQELFAGLPLVFFCVNNIDYAKSLDKDPCITGAVEEFYLADTLEIALKFQPGTRHVIGICDDTLTGRGDQKQFYALAAQYPEYDFSVLNASHYNRAEFAEQLENLPADSIVIYMSYFADDTGDQYTISQSVQFLAEHSFVPIYRTSVGGVGDGLLGGRMVSYDDSGRVAAGMVMRILDDKVSPAEIPVVTKGESHYYFDYQLLKKYGIDMSLVPSDAILIHRDPTFLEEYQNVLLPVLLVLLFSLLLLAAVGYDNLRQRRFAAAIRQSHEELQNTYERLKLTEGKLEKQYEENTKYTCQLEEQEKQIRYQAEHDYLTGLPDRRAAMEHLKELAEAKQPMAVLLLDVDDFKEINDANGHSCGDAILAGIASRFDAVRQTHAFYAARFGGDEFLLISRCAKMEQVISLAEDIRRMFQPAFLFNGKEHYLKISMGLVCTDGQSAEASELVANADLAMYAAKKAGKNDYVYYDARMKAEMIRNNEIKERLDAACRQDNFVIVYQPQIETATRQTHGYEALVRLKDQSISPGQFIPLAEETDTILTIGRIVTRKVVEQLAVWRAHGISLHPVAINFSSKQLRDTGYVRYLQELLEKHQIAAEFIEIEITESIFLRNSERAMTLFHDFLSMGVRLALDDFGTGYSSIHYLTYIPVHKIKLDKSVVDAYLCDGKDAFIENIIRLSHSQGFKITVEGVEQEHQYERLRSFGCDYIQGYYFSRPVSGEAIEEQKLY